MADEPSKPHSNVANETLSGGGDPQSHPQPAPMNLDSSVEIKPHRLGQFASTAICSNDITSSCLYVSALTIIGITESAFVAIGIFAFHLVISQLGGVRLII